MKGKHCRLYDEQLVKSIMISTGLLTMDFIKEKQDVNEDEIYEFLEINAENIIEDTLDEMSEKDDSPPFGESDTFPDSLT